MTVLVGVGLLGGHALAVTVPVPTVPTVTVSALPVTVTTPIATVSAPTATVSAPTSASLPTVAPPLPAGAVQAPLSTQAESAVPAATTGSAGSTSATSSASGPDRTRVERLRSSRPWIATSGSKRHRSTTLTFVLPHGARVVFVVKQLAPVCRIAARFAVNAHAGRNRIRFPGRRSKLRLDPGTYRITARTRAGQVIQRVTIVVVKGGAPTRGQIIAARVANVCVLSAASGSTGASNTTSYQRALTPGPPSARGQGEVAKTHPRSCRGSTVATARAVQPLLVALLALAIFLLTAASLPRPALRTPAPTRSLRGWDGDRRTGCRRIRAVRSCSCSARPHRSWRQ
jgi:hypothetical protein